MVEMDEVLAFLEAKQRGGNPSQSWTQLKNVKLKDGTTIEEYTVDGSPELETKLVEKVFGIDQVSPPTPIVESSNFQNTLLSEVVEKFCEENSALMNWTKKTAIEVKATPDLFTTIVDK
jgi:hypothetical protein